MSVEGGDPATAEAVLVVRKVIRASPEQLFAAWTEPRHLMHWWGPDGVACPEAEVDLRVGGRYRLANRMPDGQVHWIEGMFETVEPPHQLIYSWTMGGDETVSERVTVRFDRQGTATEVLVRHERIRDPETARTHRLGWDGCLEGLRAYAEARPAGSN